MFLVITQHLQNLKRIVLLNNVKEIIIVEEKYSKLEATIKITDYRLTILDQNRN